VGNRISPVVEIIEQLLPGIISRIECLHPIPDLNAEPRKVGTDITGIRITPVEFAIEYQHEANDVLQRSRNLLDNLLYTLRM